eukprot:s1845_g5.t1
MSNKTSLHNLEVWSNEENRFSARTADSPPGPSTWAIAIGEVSTNYERKTGRKKGDGSFPNHGGLIDQDFSDAVSTGSKLQNV